MRREHFFHVNGGENRVLRMYLWTVDAQRLLRFASDLDGYWRTGRVRVPIKTAMKKEQVRERERYTRKTRFSPPFT